MDVCLVNMPFAFLNNPLVALGLLQAALEREHVSASSIYANLLFADQIGIEEYYRFSTIRAEDGLYDWFFARVAFPEFSPNDDAYVRLVRDCNRCLRDVDVEQLRESLFRMREKVWVFVEDLAKRILHLNPRIVGCTTTCQQHVASLALLRQIHEMAPGVITMMGGAWCDSMMGRTTHRSFPWVDYVVSGEADELIGRLVLSILEKGRNVEPHELPEGVFAPAHRGEGYPVRHDGGAEDAPRAVVRSLDDLPLPNYDDYFETLQTLQNLRQRISPMLQFETSRGCWWGRKNGCTFCGLTGKSESYRSKKPERVIGEMHALSTRYGVSCFFCVDNILDMHYFKTVLPELKRIGSPYRIFYATKSNLDRQQVQDLHDAGVTIIQPGIESLDSRVLALMKKGCESWDNVQLLKWCGQNGVSVVWNMLYGFPGEEDEWYLEMAEILPLLTHLQPPEKMGSIRYLRYSHYHLNPESCGLHLIPQMSAPFIYPLADKELANQVSFFEDEGRVEISRHPVQSILFGRPGIEAIAWELSEWARLFQSEDPPVLNMSHTATALHIRDTRPAATASSFVLEGIEREIYLACDHGPKMEDLKKVFTAKGIDEEKLMAIVQRLQAQKLLLRIDGRLIALALTDPLTPLPEPGEFPLGTIMPTF